MPESTIKGHVETVVQHCSQVRAFLTLNPQSLENIKIHLNLTKPQTLSILQRLEENAEISCTAGVWQLDQD